MRLSPTLLASLLATGVVVSPAGAADPTWTGVHVGIDLSMIEATSAITDVDYDYFGSTLNMSQKSGAVGLRAGYDHQFGELVVGADLTWLRTNIDDTLRYSNDVDISNTLTNLVALRIRGGMAVGSSLIYVTGGLAKGNFSHDFVDDGSPQNSVTDADNDQIGSVLGLGLETLVTAKVSVRGEFAFYDIPATSKDTGSGDEYQFADQVTSFTLGASYRF